MIYEELLREIAESFRSYREELQPPCTPEMLADLGRRAKSQLGIDLPTEYGAFLQITNGLDSNGLVIYGSQTSPILGYTDRYIQGFVEANLAWWGADANRAFVCFGDSGSRKYAYHLSQLDYQVLDRQSNSLIASVPSFDHLVFEAFKAHRPRS